MEVKLTQTIEDSIEESNESVNEEINEKTDLNLSKEKADFIDDFPDALKKSNSRILEITLLSLFSCLAFMFGMIFLSDHITAATDGGYYELQVATLLSEGKFYYETPILPFLIIALFSLIFNNITFGVTFSVSLFLAAAVITNYFAARIVWNRKVATLTLPFSLLSVLYLRMAPDLTKNLIAMVFIPLAIAYFNQFHLTKKWKFFALSLTFTGLTAFSHLMSSLALSVCLVGYFVTYNILNSLEDWKIDWKKLLYSAGILLASAVVMILFWLISEYLVPVKETYWEYSSNVIPDGSSGYTPSEEGLLYPLSALFTEMRLFDVIILIASLIVLVIVFAFNPNFKDRHGLIMLWSMSVPIWLLGISLDVNGWLWRMAVDLAAFIVLAGAFLSSLIVKGLEKGWAFLDKKVTGNLNRFRPKISFTIIIIGLLIFPMIFKYIKLGTTINPILNESEVADLEDMEGKLADPDCLIYARHGFEYWVTYFTGYQTQNMPSDMFSHEDLYDLLNVSSPTTYFITGKNEGIPMVVPNSGPVEFESFTLITPLNASVHTSPYYLECFSFASDNVVRIEYKMHNLHMGTLEGSGELVPTVLPDGNYTWTKTLSTGYPQVDYLVTFQAEYMIGGDTFFEKIDVIFFLKEPFFKTVYVGKIFGVIEANPNFIAGPTPQQGEEPHFEPPQMTSKFNILTFILKIDFPFLTDYLHYYFTIPLAVVYWTLLLFGTFRLIRLGGKLITKKQQAEEI